MSFDFDEFDKIVNVSSVKNEEDNCSCVTPHEVFENGIILCINCGEQLKKPLIHNKEWRVYSDSDNNKRNNDPNRLHARKIEDKGISRDVEHMNFSNSIVTKANEIYLETTKGQIFRGGSRKSIIFACIFHAYKLAGNVQTPESLIKLFGLTRKAGLKGLKIVNVNIPKDSEIHNTVISPTHIIKDIMNRFITTDEQKEEVCLIYKKIRNRSSKLNRARPQSLACSVIYYWILKNDIKITLNEFANIAGLSELTIQKNTKEVTRIIENLN